MKREGWICLIGIAISRLALAVPEAQIELSIYDLIPKKVDPSISANYAAEVASKIESNKEHLVACFKPGTLGIENYFAQIRITPFGMAQPTVVTQDEKQAQDPRSLNCLVQKEAL